MIAGYATSNCFRTDFSARCSDEHFDLAYRYKKGAAREQIERKELKQINYSTRIPREGGNTKPFDSLSR